jgi:copper chaperone CopZ
MENNMKKSFDVSGMHCQSCVGKIQQALQNLEQIQSADVTLSPPKAIIELSSEVPVERLQTAVASAGSYKLQEVETPNSQKAPVENDRQDKSSLYPLFLVVAYILGVVIFAGLSANHLTISWVMRQFMAGFFITFSFFKLLDLSGFVSAFRGYDLIAKRYPTYGWTYPFIELALGCSYLTGAFLVPAYITTILIMGVGAIGVLKVILNEESIQCACLGTVLDLPMTKITLVENLSMIVMAILMILL